MICCEKDVYANYCRHDIIWFLFDLDGISSVD
jgi:hypothetical protein